ncbi:rRNA maturation RNase YbeY [Dysgonomonas sp. 520]|uniref:rRNA maturation RNase YbeY n=1 Tax=Dysgonomonas sp. 520 TaxID=2302931 RepID=UPI0013D4C224|nr:rRNA maturation RNase YbeY [Dysgonomonas sp. 520]NDW10845.1 rRNA maturation RNase YbeY [Dysgonomonas sp. 520]
MAILFQNEEVKLPPIKRRIISQWIKQTAASYNKAVGDVAYIFCSDEKILQINREYLQHDYYTDIITFDYSEDNIISGDIFISLDTVKSNSEQFGTDFIDELHRIIIHGILHLCGINDKSPEERKHMTQCEDEALKNLKLIIS